MTGSLETSRAAVEEGGYQEQHDEYGYPSAGQFYESVGHGSFAVGFVSNRVSDIVL